MFYVWILISFAVAYVLGSISFAVIIAKRHGVDILKAGSGNPGATNVKRVVGSRAGNVVFVLDFLKGFVAAHWPYAGHHMDFLPADAPVLWMGIAGLIGVVLGHSCSLFLGFRGGKGVASSIGGLIALMPFVTIGGLIVWVAMFDLTLYVSVASMAMGLSLMPLAVLLGEPKPLIGLSFVLAVYIIVRHRTNLMRLMEGKENKFERPKGHSMGELCLSSAFLLAMLILLVWMVRDGQPWEKFSMVMLSGVYLLVFRFGPKIKRMLRGSKDKSDGH